MILPIYIYGHPALRKKTIALTSDYPELNSIIENMFETMYNAEGVGLAAPQVGLNLRLFIVDASPFEEDNPELKNFKKVFINPVINEESGDEWSFNEGCLSIPTIREDVDRKPNIKIEYYDRNFNKYEEFYDGIIARVIQHEYDHIEGVLFTDKVSSLKKMMLNKKLDNIAKGKIDYKYPVRLAASPAKKK